MTAADSSVVVAAFASWHELHEQAARRLDSSVRLPAQVALESYSVLTRLPAPHRTEPRLVRTFLFDRFVAPWLALGADEHRDLVGELAALGISGGATYDAVVSAAARAVGARLLTCDRRAAAVYERLRVDVELIGV